MKVRLILVLILASFAWCASAVAAELEVIEETVAADAPKEAVSVPATKTESAAALPEAQESKLVASSEVVTTNKKVMPPPPDVCPTVSEPTRYTLGPDDVIEIIVRRHPEFSDKFIINGEGKIQYKFVGDIDIKGMTKTEVKDRVTQLLSKFIINPDVDVTILDYRSKVIYVIGEVGSPGKYFMRTDKILLREAIVLAGLPTLAAAMRRTTLIRPDMSGKPTKKTIDLYALLYEGKLNLNEDMYPGDVVFVPATFFAKLFRIINPVTDAVSSAKSAASPIY